MKINSSFMEALDIQIGEVHTLHFSNSYHQMKFRSKINDYFQGKNVESDFVTIVDDNFLIKEAKEFYYINFDFTSINLETEKETNALVRKVLMYHLNHNQDLISLFSGIENAIEEFFLQINIEYDDLDLEFEITDKVIENMVKAVKVHFNFKNEEIITNSDIRKLLISSLLDLNMLKKKVFILLSFPEAEIAKDKLGEFNDYLKGLNVTVLIITSDIELIKKTTSKNLFLMSEYGRKYDIIKLQQELEEFMDIENDHLVILTNLLAYHDLREEYLLLDSKYQHFLNSSKI